MVDGFESKCIMIGTRWGINPVDIHQNIVDHSKSFNNKFNMSIRVIVTGGAGFIGSSFANLCVSKGLDVLVVDKLTYASNVDIIPKIPILKKDICDVTAEDLGEYDFLVNFAAESHI